MPRKTARHAATILITAASLLPSPLHSSEAQTPAPPASDRNPATESTAAEEGAAVGPAYLVAAGRSPIPQPGETFDTPLAFRRLVPAPEAPPPGETIAWNQAHRYVGQVVTVEAEVVNTYNHQGRVCFLNFTDHWQGQFYVPVFPSVFESMGEPPETYYLHQRVRVRGEVTLHRNRPNIEVRDPNQIERLP